MHIRFPTEMVKQIDELSGKRQRSEFIRGATAGVVHKQRLMKALREAAGCWKDKDHPELKRGAAAYIRKLRWESEKSFRKKMGL